MEYSYKFTKWWLAIKVSSDTGLSKVREIVDEIYKERPKTRLIPTIMIEQTKRIKPHGNRCWYCGRHEPFQEKWRNNSGEKWMCHRHSVMVQASLELRSLEKIDLANRLDDVVGIETNPDLCQWIELPPAAE